MGAFLLLFTSWWGPFLGLAPPTKISAGTHGCKGSRACSSEFFYVTTDMFCYDFALKMTKIMINCSHVTDVPAKWV